MNSKINKFLQKIPWIPLILCVIFGGAFVFRLYHFNKPMADLHSWRQSDTAAVARNLTTHNYDVLHPEIQSAVNIDGMQRDNKPRYHFAEFPFYQLGVAWLSTIFDNSPIAHRFVLNYGTVLDDRVDRGAPLISDLTIRMANYSSDDSIVRAGRIVSIVSSLACMWVLYLLVRLYFSERVGLLSTAIFGWLPFTVFWSRAVLPDMFMLLFILLFLYYFSRWINSNKLVYLVVSAICFSVALLLKAFAPFMLLPVVYLLWSKYKFAFLKKPVLWILALLAILPFIAWRMWMQQWPMSIPASNWLFNGSQIRFKPAWWHWMLQQRLDTYMFNATGLFLIGVGVALYKDAVEFLHNEKHSQVAKYIWFFPLCLLSCLIYFTVFATGNVQHEYYQIPILPFGSVFAALGFWYLWMKKGSYIEMVSRRLSVIFLLGITLLLGWYSVKEWYSINNPMLVYVGQRADDLLPKDAVVIADYGGDTTFLYYVNRPGWSVREKQVDQLIERGATHYISMYRNEYMNRLAKLYTVVDESPEYVILDLRQKTNNPEWSTIERYEL